MKNKLIFRIFGALASALIIVSVFVPFISINGFATSLWDSYQIINSLYLPIMIMAFGLIGVIFFSLNIKTEFAYMTSGAITFFVVMSTISYFDNFSSLSMGYYFLAIGALLTAIMAFICNLRTKVVSETSKVEEAKNETSVLDQIDKLYNDQSPAQNQMQESQSFDTGFQIQSLDGSGIQPLSTIEATPIEPQLASNPVVQEIPSETPAINPEIAVQNNDVIPVVEPIQVQQPVNPVVQDFAQPTQVIEPTQVQQPVNPVVQDFEQPTQVVEPTQVQQPVNPVVQDFAQPTQVVEPTQVQQPVNPVVQGFMNPSTTEPVVIQSEPTPSVNAEIPSIEPVQSNEELKPVNPVVEGFTNPNSSSVNNNQGSSLDIFGQ